MALSAARAWLFNHVLDRRVTDDSWRHLLPGDCAGLDGSGSVFVVECPDAELERRAASQDIHPTGPLWGRGTLPTSGAIETLERDVARQFASLAEGLVRLGVEQQRRVLRVAVRDLAWEEHEGAVVLSFRLTRGAFATAVLREVAEYREAASPSP
jgi:tRNA pseudouridine13 synthase